MLWVSFSKRANLGNFAHSMHAWCAWCRALCGGSNLTLCEQYARLVHMVRRAWIFSFLLRSRCMRQCTQECTWFFLRSETMCAGRVRSKDIFVLCVQVARLVRHFCALATRKVVPRTRCFMWPAKNYKLFTSSYIPTLG